MEAYQYCFLIVGLTVQHVPLVGFWVELPCAVPAAGGVHIPPHIWTTSSVLCTTFGDFHIWNSPVRFWIYFLTGVYEMRTERILSYDSQINWVICERVLKQLFVIWVEWEIFGMTWAATAEKKTKSCTKHRLPLWDTTQHILYVNSCAKKPVSSLIERERVCYLVMSSVWAQVLCVLCCWDVSVGVGLECGREVLLVVGVVYAVLRLVLLNAVHRAVEGEGENGRGWDLVEVLGSVEPVVEAVQVLRLWLVWRHCGEEGARRTRVLVDGVHHVWHAVLVHVVWRKRQHFSRGTNRFPFSLYQVVWYKT